MTFHARFAKDGSLDQDHLYGYGWHFPDLHSGSKSYKVFAAEGNGGQFVIVISSLDLVVGITVPLEARTRPAICHFSSRDR